MKYIVLRTTSGEVPVVFPPIVQHRVMAAGFIEAGMRVVSAGFVRIRGRRHDDTTDDTMSVVCSGRSQGLGLQSRPDRDAALIQASLHLPD